MLLALTLVYIAIGGADEPNIIVEEPMTIVEELGVEEVFLIMYALESLDIRADATSASEGIGQYNTNDEVIVTGKLSNGWVRVSVAGMKGYVYKSNLSTENPKPITENPSVEPKPEEDNNSTSPSLPIIKDGDYLLALVTKNTTLGQYMPSDLVRIPSKMVGRDGNKYLRQEALTHLIKMWEDAKEEGATLLIVSAFRSYELQQTIFTRNASIHGEIQANRFSARPGQSEHQLGTAVDFVGRREESLTASFAGTPSGKWLMLNSYRYGFVMSYPEGKEHITGYVFEPWHYRFIGVEAALEWKESGLTLKEFLKTKPQEFK